MKKCYFKLKIKLFILLYFLQNIHKLHKFLESCMIISCKMPNINFLFFTLQFSNIFCGPRSTTLQTLFWRWTMPCINFWTTWFGIFPCDSFCQQTLAKTTKGFNLRFTRCACDKQSFELCSLFPACYSQNSHSTVKNTKQFYPYKVLFICVLYAHTLSWFKP